MLVQLSGKQQQRPIQLLWPGSSTTPVKAYLMGSLDLIPAELEFWDRSAWLKQNGRGILHLHALVWLSGNLGFSTLRDRVLQDESFASRMIYYLESIIMYSIDLGLENDPSEPAFVPPSANGAETDDEFYSRLSVDSNAVSCKKQIYLSNHNGTCFKYSRNGQGSETCRFEMPRELRPISDVDEFGVIHLACNNGWVNPWNPVLAACVCSNQDIAWIPIVVKELCLIYYITNYII